MTGTYFNIPNILLQVFARYHVICLSLITHSEKFYHPLLNDIEKDRHCARILDYLLCSLQDGTNALILFAVFYSELSLTTHNLRISYGRVMCILYYTEQWIFKTVAYSLLHSSVLYMKNLCILITLLHGVVLQLILFLGIFSLKRALLKILKGFPYQSVSYQSIPFQRL